jgi:transposase
MPPRWMVERSFAWFSRNRRLSKDYERYQKTGELWLYLAMSRILLHRLAAKPAT